MLFVDVGLAGEILSVCWW